jgi:pimeloyl-ACP methyl ester carboxylesterase
MNMRSATGLLLTGILVLTLLLPVSAVAQQAPDGQRSVEGFWQGSLQARGIELRLVFALKLSSNQTLTATMDSPDQGATGIPCDSATFDGQTLHLGIKRILMTYEGALSKDGSEISGTFHQAGTTLPLVLKRVDKPVTISRPQEPKRPYPYDEEEVSYENKTAPGVKLAGTLTLPRSNGPFAAVLLITGSGPQDRDEALLGHKPFLVLSDYLTRRGIAVLRVDDRGVGKSTGNFGTATTRDFASDALAGVEYLKTRKEIDAKRIGLVGHSEGGVIAPMVAAESADVAFIVMMAGTGLPGDEVLYVQSALIAKANGASDELIATTTRAQREIFAIVKQESDNAAAIKRIREVMEKVRAGLTTEQRQAVGYESAIESQIAPLLTPWFRYFLAYDPKAALRKVTCPVLAVNGANDLQVPPKENLPAIEQALEDGGNSDHQIVKLPGLNHLFQTSKTGSPTEYAKIDETISPAALAAIGDWLIAHSGKSQSVP